MLALANILILTRTADALPSFAQQTGMACSACHIGAFGPQLTPQGRAFKLEGYTDAKPTNPNEPDWMLPLAAMAVTSFNHTQKNQADKPAPHFSTNDNFALDEASIFIAGRIVGPLGAFIQITYDGIGRQVSLDNTDIRAVHHFDFSGTDLLVGVSVNNNPTVQDAWNTTPAWGFPFTSSGLAPAPAAATLIDGGLEQQVIGATVYALWDKSFYFESGLYRALGRNTQRAIGLDTLETNDMSGVSPYWRFAWQKEFDGQYVAVGTFGLYSQLYPGHDHSANATDNYLDWGFDATYQFLGTRTHVATVNAAFINEWRHMNATASMGDADHVNQQLRTAKINASYHYDQTYGLTVGYFNTWGSRDRTYYGEDSRTGKPTTSGVVAQVDWTPFGKDDSWGAPWVNLRLGLQYTAYFKFNGSQSNYDGSGRSASANNTIFGFAWLAF